MNCHLLVPHLFWPVAAGIEPYRDLDLPSLETLLARGRRTRTGGATVERWLAAAFGLTGDSPLAAHALRGDGVEPGNDCWMCADPVHMRVHGDRLVLADTTHFSLTPMEAREFVAALNTHFGGEGITLIAPHPQRWYLRLADTPRLHTTPTAEAAGRSIESLLPTGEDGAHWRRVINEAQMLLHDHPRNEEREARGELPVNSIWPWGAGRAGSVTSSHDALWSNHPLATGLAMSSRIAAHSLPATGSQILASLRGNIPLVVLANLPATAYGDLNGWREALLDTERDWLAPLLAALKNTALESLTLHGLGVEFGYRTELRRNDSLRFWRRKRPLAAYAKN